MTAIDVNVAQAASLPRLPTTGPVGYGQQHPQPSPLESA